jgi:hypothetical protein
VIVSAFTLLTCQDNLGKCFPLDPSCLQHLIVLILLSDHVLVIGHVVVSVVLLWSSSSVAVFAHVIILLTLSAPLRFRPRCPRPVDVGDRDGRGGRPLAPKARRRGEGRAPPQPDPTAPPTPRKHGHTNTHTTHTSVSRSVAGGRWECFGLGLFVVLFCIVICLGRAGLWVRFVVDDGFVM